MRQSRSVPKSATALAIAAALVAAVVVKAPITPTAGAATPPPESPADTRLLPDSSLQIVVFEVSNCIYCSLFRRHVEPVYAASAQARSVPMRFMDLNDSSADYVTLQRPVDQVPTAVLIENNKEIGRIPGYVGPEVFFRAVSHLLGSAH